MKIRFFSLFLAFFVLFGLSACTLISPNGDQVAVVVTKPWIFGHGGIEPEVVKTGRSIEAYSSSAVYYKTTPWNLKESFTDMNTSDNFPVDFDVYINLKIIPDKAPTMLRDFGDDQSSSNDVHMPRWYANNLSPEIREIIRKEMSKYTMFTLAVRGKEFDKSQEEVIKNISAFIKKKGIPVTLEGVSFSKVNPDQKVIDARVETAAQEQRVATETNKIKAEKERKKAEQARAEADDAYAKKMGLSPEQFVRLEQAKTCAISKGCTLVLGDVKPVINTAK
jgi:SPFH domain / Band 7 family